ncbi:DUF1990 family protein [Protaetiibacter larvae]|uniref:DUF1990 domain-containing protein n=1 Tax=Protaetiibacter larvae TaxID=2592654 RepID=A0A5C1Y841_9MICO|nr:DUF1990 domain-containing protein [Protaetiibacter larvae]QEO09800.1 DUF1990 domain-containing protein [Protaetiibacter larvae]
MTTASAPPGDAPRRSTAAAQAAVGDPAELWRVPVSYGAVGATQADDLLQYPPRGYRALEKRIRVGHGEQRWEYAWMRVLSWGIQRGAGFEVTPVDAPPAATAASYVPVAFDASGRPVQPATVGDGGEVVYTTEGDALVRPGDTGMLRAPFWPVAFPVRVVYVIDEPTRRGAAFGTLPGHPLAGEELFLVERRDDDSVWLTVRIFSRAADGPWKLVLPALRVVQAFLVRRYLHELTGRIG